ncbi:MAG: alpha/beta fold hydrolase [Gammaproteobacteria bacterium]|nr:alpha/beta fold hydrolase [Gammaproteobacteria bacterium]
MTINFQKMGQGEPIVIIHGLFGTSDNLKQIAKALSDTRLVYLIDLPGHGGSDSTHPLSLVNMAKRIHEFCQSQSLNNFDVLGHSLGGKVAMELALMQPLLIRSLIVADIAPVEYPRRHDAIIQGLQSVDLINTPSRQQADKTLQTLIDDRGIRAFLIKSLKRDKSNSMAWQWDFDLQNLAKDYDLLIKAPRKGVFDKNTLFIIGGESNYVLPEHKQEIIERFPNVKVKVIQNAGHWLHAEKPVAFEKICRDFLSQ